MHIFVLRQMIRFISDSRRILHHLTNERFDVWFDDTMWIGEYLDVIANGDGDLIVP